MTPHGFLFVDKPVGWTSHDVVAKVRRLLQTRRVGHAGTLDPAATGVLVLGVGKATRLIDAVQHQTKQYVAHVVLGVSSETADIDGACEQAVTWRPSPADVRTVVERFTGEFEQVPPKYSALKRGGIPLYRLARRGEVVEVPARQVRLERVDVLDYHFPDVWIDVVCGPGFYVRSLARDIGDLLGCGAYLHHLRRTRIGSITLGRCWPIDELINGLSQATWPAYGLHPDEALLSGLAACVDQRESYAWYHGRSVGANAGRWPDGSSVRVYRTDGHWSGVGLIDGARGIRPRQVFDAPDWEPN